MAEDAGLKILEDASLEGTASVVERLDDEGDEAASLALKQHLDQQEVGRAGARLDREAMRSLLERVRGMTQVADLGRHPTKLDWMAFHVPPGGTGQLQFEVTGTQHTAVRLKVMGLGGGAGRNVTFAAERDLGTRSQCFALGAWMEVRLRTFRGRGDNAPEELRVDVEAVTHSYVEPLQPCKLCFTEAARRPPLAKPAGIGWDLTSDDLGVTERLTVAFTRETEMEVALQIPGLPLGELVPGVAMKREVQSRCDALYTFPGRANFVGYELIGKPKNFPFWGRS